MHGPSILTALQRYEQSLEAELARLVPAVPPEAGELVESAALNVAQARKLIGAEVASRTRGDLIGLAEWAEAVAGLLLEAGRKAREADRIVMSGPVDAF